MRNQRVINTRSRPGRAEHRLRALHAPHGTHTAMARACCSAACVTGHGTSIVRAPTDTDMHDHRDMLEARHAPRARGGAARHAHAHAVARAERKFTRRACAGLRLSKAETTGAGSSSTGTASSAWMSTRGCRRARSGRRASSCRSSSSTGRRSRASPARAHGTDHANVGGRRPRQQRDAGTRAGMAPQWESGDRAATLRNAPTCCAVMPASNFMPRLCVCLDRNKIL